MRFFIMSFREATLCRQALSVPGSTNAARAVKTERALSLSELPPNAVRLHEERVLLRRRLVKRHGRSWRFRPKASRCWRANAFLKPSHRIASEQRFSNTVEEPVFQRFSWDIVADNRSFPIPRFSEHRNLLRADLLLIRRECAPRKPCGNRKGKWGDENRRNRRISLLVLAWLCRFTYLCVKEPPLCRGSRSHSLAI